MRAAGLTGLALGAGGVFAIGRQELTVAAQRAGIAIEGIALDEFADGVRRS
jgi:DUF1009 family protein